MTVHVQDQSYSAGFLQGVSRFSPNLSMEQLLLAVPVLVGKARGSGAYI